MGIVSTTALAFSMSADAFAVSVAKGASVQKPRWRDALRCGAIFGIVEAITPILGWLVGIAASSYIAAIDHWVALAILGLVGAKLVYEGFSPDDVAEEKPKRHGIGLLILTAFGTSIDAMAVGVTLAFIDANIWITAAAIGAATCVMVTIGTMTGHYIGAKIGKYAEVLGGLCLILIGITIVLEHTKVI